MMATATRVLLVEDSAGARMLLHHVLARAGYDVVEAVDGSEAWDLLLDHSFDVIVSDLQMPGMDGLELVRRVRSTDFLSHMRVIVNTSLDAESDREAAIKAGADAYFTKRSRHALDAILGEIERLTGPGPEHTC
jgi:CheY-like chemotaxis protein